MNTKFFVAFFIVVLTAPFLTSAKIITKDVEYKEGNAVLQGFVAYDDAWKPGTHAGVIIVHEWTGLGDYVKSRAKQMAELGYVAFAADIYGKGIRPKTPDEAGKEAGKYKGDRPLLRKRVIAAVQELKKMNLANSAKLGAMGYCFGGTTVLELARSGSPDIKAVVSFHGGLETPLPAKADSFKTHVLVLHGADDPYVKRTEVDGFKKEMADAKAQFEIVEYPGAVHSFTNPEAGNDNSKGAAYNKNADLQSFEKMKVFFATELK